MNAKLSFLGAAQNVTGSCYVLEAAGRRVMVDCGMYQERDLRGRNWEPFAVQPADIDAVLLTHAHLDHCGLLPKLVREGFRGRIYCTDATADIAKIVLLDSGRIQEEDAAYKKRRHEKEGRQGRYPEVPLYTVADAEAALPRFEAVDYGRETAVADVFSVRFVDAGHILGSSSVAVTAPCNGGRRTVLFSGDVGRYDTPILRDPAAIPAADYVLVESTYGNRDHKDNSTIPDTLASVINETHRRGGKVCIPSFAVERSQELLYHLSLLLNERRIPRLPVFLDSPMAVRVTEVFRRHPELFDEEAMALLREGRHPCDFPELIMARTVDESKAINELDRPAIVIAGSGMCTGGRIKHHLRQHIWRPESAVLFVGYQAVGTLGRIILEGAEQVRIHGRRHEVAAMVRKVNGFSAHGDRGELLRWLTAGPGKPRRVFVTHGEPEAAAAFGQQVGAQTGWPVTVAEYRRTVTLD